MRVLVVLILFLFFFSSVLFASGNLCSSGFSRFTETERELQVTEQRFSSSRCQHGSESYDKAVLCVVFIILSSPRVMVVCSLSIMSSLSPGQQSK